MLDTKIRFVIDALIEEDANVLEIPLKDGKAVSSKGKNSVEIMKLDGITKDLIERIIKKVERI